MKKLFHYTSINNLALILSSKKIRFNRLDNVNDPHEGVTSDFHDLSHYLFVSCWTNFEEENLALWNMYTPQMRGVRIELPSPIFNSYKIDTNELNIDNYLIPENEIVDDVNYVLNLGGKNEPVKIEYTNDKEKLKPKIVDPNVLHLSKIGKYKSLIWSFENEFRYILTIVPIDKGIKGYNPVSSYSKKIRVNIPPSIKYYDIGINNDSFNKMKIRLSPKIQSGDFEIISALVDKYNLNAEIIKGDLMGVIK